MVGAISHYSTHFDQMSAGLELVDPISNWQSDISKDSALTLRCFVKTALIPLYARNGPNLELHTTNIETSEWLKDKFLGNAWLDEEELDGLQSFQCPVGLLIGVDDPARRSVSGVNTSDLLVYGVLSTSTLSFERPPSPPVSSSSGHHDNIGSVKRELRIYAAPLAASLITKAQSLPSPPHSPTDNDNGGAQFAEFLPDFRSPSPKRKRVATLFESVTQHHQRVRQKGGEAVSQMMAHSLSQPSQQLQALKVKSESEELLPTLDRIRSQRSKSLSSGSLRMAQSRPRSARGRAYSISRKGTPLLESSTQRVSSPALPSSEGKLEYSTPKDAETIMFENKSVITKTILTCMRLYGFNRKAPRLASTTANAPDGPDLDVPHIERDSRTPGPDGAYLTAPASGTEEDEFKSMYHATYRASTFALRKYLKEPSPTEGGSQALPPLLDKRKAMTYIDEFLRLFCEESRSPSGIGLEKTYM